MFGLFKKNYEDISIAETKEVVHNKAYMIIDVRSEGEYRSGHIKSSTLIPLPTLKKNLNKIDKTKTIITVCASGARSASAAAYLAEQGYSVKNMTGGMARWAY